MKNQHTRTFLDTISDSVMEYGTLLPELASQQEILETWESKFENLLNANHKKPIMNWLEWQSFENSYSLLYKEINDSKNAIAAIEEKLAAIIDKLKIEIPYSNVRFFLSGYTILKSKEDEIKLEEVPPV